MLKTLMLCLLGMTGTALAEPPLVTTVRVPMPFPWDRVPAAFLKPAAPAAPVSRVTLTSGAGTWHVPVEVDGMPAQFMVDSGAATVVLTADLYARLRSLGAIRDEDLRPAQTFTLADGSQHSWQTFVLRSLKVGSVTIENVHAAAKPTSLGNSLLGQPFLGRLKSWHVDNLSHELVLAQ
jgi:clan AA aspartic protease (TIGR02281 family)